MADLTLPSGLVSQTETVLLRANTAQFDRRAREREGEYWRFTNTYLPQTTAVEAELRGVLAQLRSLENRLTVTPHSNPNRGVFGGTPLVNGNTARGSRTMDIDGCPISTANWIRQGDFFAIQNSGTWELKMSVADTGTDSSGEATLEFVPALKNQADDDTAIVTSSPLGTFILATPARWLKEPGYPIQVTIEIEEVSE